MKTIENINITGKKVLIRCDFNVPIKNGKIIDDNRIKKSIKTIKYALKYAKHVIIISHLGRIKTKEDMQVNSLKIVCDYLSKLIDEKIIFCTYIDDVQKNIENNKIVMLENTRYFDLDNTKESSNDENLAKYFASLADVYINDAFGVCHRSAASTTGVSRLLESAIGFLVEEEINKLSELFNPDRPFTIILGGSKVSDKIGIISNLIEKCDKLVIVGAMSFTFLKAKGYSVGNSILDIENIDYAKDLLEKYGEKIILPSDIYIADTIDSDKKKLVKIDNISKMGLDIGPNTILDIKKQINNSKMILVNGPAGAYENPTFSYGTEELLKYLSSLDAKVIIGGGDSASAAINLIGENKFYHISTGGGASLEFLEGKVLPGLRYIGD